MRRLSTRDVARILGLREARVRELVRAGLCRPARRGRRYAFSFQDLVVLRAAQGLLAAHVPAARVQRALAALVEKLPDDRPASGLRIFADGRRVAVRDGNAAFDPETGQILLDFGTDELAARVAALGEEPAPDAAAAKAGEARAREAFQRALDVEDRDPEAARRHYREALAHDPTLSDAYVNLGRLAHEEGDAREAARLWHLALERAPDDPMIHYNLALALEDVSGAEGAAAHYERALALDPDFADAHFNLAGLCEALGRPHEALRHYQAYRKLTEG